MKRGEGVVVQSEPMDTNGCLDACRRKNQSNPQRIDSLALVDLIQNEPNAQLQYSLSFTQSIEWGEGGTLLSLAQPVPSGAEGSEVEGSAAKGHSLVPLVPNGTQGNGTEGSEAEGPLFFRASDLPQASLARTMVCLAS